MLVIKAENAQFIAMKKACAVLKLAADRPSVYSASAERFFLVFFSRRSPSLALQHVFFRNRLAGRVTLSFCLSLARPCAHPIGIERYSRKVQDGRFGGVTDVAFHDIAVEQK